MKRFFLRNLESKGRLLRGFLALALFVAAPFGLKISFWLGAILLAAAVFVAFEALRGWCALRACGIQTKL